MDEKGAGGGMAGNLSLILILISAVIHPLWNIILKRSEDKVVFYLHIHLVFTVLGSFILFIFPVKAVSGGAWLFIGLSSLAHFFYQVFLCRTYEAGDISLTYPIVRSSPIFVAILGFVFFRELPSAAATAGIILIIIGTQLINQDELSLSGMFRPLREKKAQALFFAALPALFSALSSVIDKKGVLEVSPILFFYLFFALSGIMFGIYALFFEKRRRNIFRIFARHKYTITLASLLEFGSYVLILYAFRLSKVAYVVALRQVSVIFGAIFGVYFLKEKYARIRILASVIIFIGAFLITAFG